MSADDAGPMAGVTSLSRDEIERRIRELGHWFHNMELGGVQTAPGHFLGDYPRVKFNGFAHALPEDLGGRSVLDIGCNGGFYAIEMKRRGAGRVVAIDSDDDYLNQARFAAEVSGHADIEFAKLDVYDVGSLGERFDLVIFMGVFYHLRHPLLALDLIREHVAGDLLLFQSMQRGSQEVYPAEPEYPFTRTDVFDEPGWPKLHFIEHEYSADWTNWFVPNAAASEALLRASGFEIVEHPEQEVYLCRRSDLPAERGPYAVYPARGR
jgi:tRNA (mo5U34)-methyltransferase